MHSPIKSIKKARVGLYSIGLKAYWNQFDGLKERLLNYGQFIELNMNQNAEVYNYGLVDSVEEGRKAGEWFNEQNIDLIFCHSATYSTSSTILPIHQICKKPVIILNLQPSSQLDYDHTTTGEWLSQCGACPVPEIANAFNRANIPFRVINGLLGLNYTSTNSQTNEVTYERKEAKRAWKEIEEWILAATVVRTLQNSRFGFLGNTYNGMLDMYSDFTMIQSQFGLHIEILEMC
ncbi:MAG: arabinose isomerase, partial [Firmicutes bacterium]|nr:arabinose isomerase [Bacillota bacterium]